MSTHELLLPDCACDADLRLRLMGYTENLMTPSYTVECSACRCKGDWFTDTQLISVLAGIVTPGDTI